MKKEQNNLFNAICYLAGPIDFAGPDYGTKWRDEFKAKCHEKVPHLKFFDPTRKPGNLGSEVGKEREYANRLKEHEKWDDLSKYVKAYRRTDLRAVDFSTFIVAYLNPSITMFGTIHEIIAASDQGKPVLILAEGGRYAMSDWLFSLVNWQEIFDNMDDCIDYIYQVDQGKVQLDSRWVFINKYME